MSLNVLRKLLLLSALLLAVSLVPGQPAGATEAADQRPHETVLRGEQLRGGDFSGTRPAHKGVVAESGADGSYTTPAIKEAAPFTDLLIRWRASLPAEAHLDLEVRASADGSSWTPWGVVEASGDLAGEDDPPGTFWGTPIHVGSRVSYWQVRVSFHPSPDGTAPVLEELSVHTVDIPQTPPERRPAPAQPSSKGAAVGRPALYTRTQWGNPQGQHSTTAPPDYYRVDHLVVHHTADSNSLSNTQTWWGDRVLAIWKFHTYSRGWGDVGYNFLIAPSGEIFEGRAGAGADFSLDPVGFHDTGNYGSMGVALVGTYSSVAPTSPAQDSLVQLLAWKAQQRGIDPLSSSYYYGCDISRYCGNAGAITPNIGGHRDIANNPRGYTSCPGDSAHSYLPSIRSRVRTLLSKNVDNGDNVVDNLEPGFMTTRGGWYSAGCGDAGQAYYTYNASSTNEHTNAGIWRMDQLTLGKYRIFVRIPQGCGLATPATSQARYTIWQNGAELGSGFTISQQTSAEWVELTTSGPLALAENPATPGYAYPIEVHLTDVTGEPFVSRVIYFDSVRFVKEVPQGRVALQNVQYDRTTLHSGELLKATFTLQNIGSGPVTLPSQDPLPAAPGDLVSGYVYDESECFLGNATQSYPAFPKETGRFRVMLGYGGYDSSPTRSCAGGTGNYPWRWGVVAPGNHPFYNSDSITLEQGQSISVVGYVRFYNQSNSASRTVTLQAGLIHEYVEYVAKDGFTRTITILPENQQPLSAQYDSSLQPQALVYELGAIPESFLARSRDPLSVPKGAFLGRFAWDGSYQSWLSGGPLGRNDNFVVEQTRLFTAPANGYYDFELTADDGAWLWVDGQQVVENHGLHPERTLIGSIWLASGQHTLSLRYFDRSGTASLGYRWKVPGAQDFSIIPRSLGTAKQTGAYLGPGSLTLAADDLGGSGMASIFYNVTHNGKAVDWQVASGRQVEIPLSSSGSYTIAYRALDLASNAEVTQYLQFSVDTVAPQSSVSASLTSSGGIRLSLSGSDDLAGIASYEIKIRDQTTGAITTWLIAAGQSVVFFGEPGRSYEFRSIARDQVGNVEAYPSASDAVQAVPSNAVFHWLYMPIAGR